MGILLLAVTIIINLSFIGPQNRIRALFQIVRALNRVESSTVNKAFEMTLAAYLALSDL